ncbi:TATA element modulatory factor [Schizosaccharomyces japonicus yFS275]|uniref:TATA element modulatory factor n=1 Tax=Schizosaccharomyces japonicus (strain yFS275 / FY16936) TaxID=402676 RepID=B6K573_SCHJY|nr:TATA element modulatory factor [Schizosaccharomyces japonicus yFS275]EEB08677.1 TATA element modulatory factor [Schizosaccharomyces japonicus yFS275]
MSNSKWSGFLKQAMSNVETSIDRVLDAGQTQPVANSTEKKDPKDVKIAQLMKEGEEWSTKELKLNNTIKSLRSTIKKLESQVSNVPGKAVDDSKITSLENELTSLRTENSHLLQKNKELEKRIEEFITKTEDLTVDNITIAKLTRKVETLTTENVLARYEWTREIEQKTVMIQKLQEENEHTKREATIISKKLDDRERELEKAKYELKVANENCKSSCQQISELESQLADLKEENGKRLQSLELELSQLKLAKESVSRTSSVTHLVIPENEQIDAVDIGEDKEQAFSPTFTAQQNIEAFLDTLSSPKQEILSPQFSEPVPRVPSVSKALNDHHRVSVSSHPATPMLAKDGTPLSARLPSSFSGMPLRTSSSEYTEGPNIGILERLASTVHQLETELQNSKQQIAQVVQQRDQARQEIVDLMVTNETSTVNSSELEELQAKCTELEQELKTNRVALQQKTEQIMDLQMDMKEMRELFKSQIDMLARR